MAKLLALFLFPFSAFAVSTTCEFPADKLDSSATIHVGSENGRAVVTSELVVNGQEVDAMAPRCFYQDVPGVRGYRCAHKVDEVRYDVYPKFTTVKDKEDNGKVKKLFIAVWQNGRQTIFETENCN